ncbi:MAG: dynamin family protein [Bacteroidetes bacterium]|jgi:ribosome biogenesis GTPase A|nr:dynamin family protein [Bacteroidota bacterium]MDF1867775.1 dynamin family protein [Saprospiraceae bacterium]
MSNLLGQNLQTQRAQIEEIIKDLHELTIEINQEELAKTISDLRNRIHEPFMFVIVGEVKAGKSSFINALLSTGEEICKVAPQPMTDTIQQVLYGEEPAEIQINQYLKKILQPVEILKEIAIVDTPGTNAIVEHHQEITERFVPASDLIVFVFEAKNPYRQSAWDFYDFIKEDWRKKIIFILQQKDLIDEEGLAINVKGVEDHAKKKGIENPIVFAVSAKQELEEQKEESGFEDVRNYIQENITGGKAPVLKMQNSIETLSNINDRISNGLNLRKKQWKADIEFRNDIRETLDYQGVKSEKQVGVLVENLVAGYDRITRQKEAELKEGLSFFGLLKRSFSGIFSKKASSKEWLEKLANDLDKDLKIELQNKLQSGITDLADSIQQMAKMIDLKIQNSQTILKNDHALFADIAERRANVLRDLQDTFSDFMQKSENFQDEELFMESQPMGQNVLTGSGLAIVGAVVTAVTQGAVFDITGGLLTTIGLVMAGFTSTVQRGKVMRKFRFEIDKGREQMEVEVANKLKQYIETIKVKIDDNFSSFDDLLVEEENQIEILNGKRDFIAERLNVFNSQLNP